MLTIHYESAQNPDHRFPTDIAFLPIVGANFVQYKLRQLFSLIYS